MDRKKAQRERERVRERGVGGREAHKARRRASPANHEAVMLRHWRGQGGRKLRANFRNMSY